MRIYRFSPIRSKRGLLEAIAYVARQDTRLCKAMVGASLPIKSLTIFAHYPEEYRRLVRVALAMGTKLTGGAARAFLTTEALPPVTETALGEALGECAALLGKFCRTKVRTSILDRYSPELGR